MEVSPTEIDEDLYVETLTEMAAEIEHCFIEARRVIAGGVEIPVGDDEVGDVPFALHAGCATAVAI